MDIEWKIVFWMTGIAIFLIFIMALINKHFIDKE
jgi:hypothetical protein